MATLALAAQLALAPELVPPAARPPQRRQRDASTAPLVAPPRARAGDTAAQLRQIFLERIYRQPAVIPSLEIPQAVFDVRAAVAERMAAGLAPAARAATEAAAHGITPREIWRRLAGYYDDAGTMSDFSSARPRAPARPDKGAALAAALSVTTRLELPGDDNVLSARRLRAQVRRGVRALYPHNSNLRKCGERRFGRHGVAVRVKGSSQDPRGVLAGLVRCSSVHSCVKCAPRICSARGEIVKRVISAHRRQTGAALEDGAGSVYMLTLTVPHSFGMKCRPLRAHVSLAWKRFQQGATWRRLKSAMRFVGSITAREITYGANGWHPHLHILLALERPLGEIERHNLEATLYGRWVMAVDAVEGMNLEAPSWEHGISLVQCSDESYVTKLGLVDELLGALNKHAKSDNRTPFQLMLEYALGPSRETGRTLREYNKGMKRARQLTWSRGSSDLRKIYAAALEGDGTPEQTDLRDAGMMTDRELLEAEEREGVMVAQLPPRQWDAVVRVMRAARVDAEYAVITAAEQDGARGVESFLAWALHTGRQLARRRPDLTRWLYWLTPPPTSESARRTTGPTSRAPLEPRLVAQA